MSGTNIIALSKGGTIKDSNIYIGLGKDIHFKQCYIVSPEALVKEEKHSNQEYYNTLERLKTVLNITHNELPAEEQVQPPINISDTNSLLALIAIKSRSYDRALKSILNLRDLKLRSSLFKALASQEILDRKYNDALKHLNYVRERNFEPDTHLLMGEAYSGLEDYFNATDHFGSAIAGGINAWPQLWKSITNLKIDKALNFTRMLFIRGLDSPKVFYTRFLVLKDSNPDEAIANKETALELDPNLEDFEVEVEWC